MPDEDCNPFFRIVPHGTTLDVKNSPCVYLMNDNWNDFGYHTTFEFYYLESQDKLYHFGRVHIMAKEQTTTILGDFDSLDDSFCSMGWGQSYYESFMELNESLQNDILKKMNDCVYNPLIFDQFQGDRAFQQSLMRDKSQKDIHLYKSILAGKIENTHFNFIFTTNNDMVNVDIEVSPQSKPPTNIHTIIGRNSVGKTTLLSEISKSFLGEKSTHPLSGKFNYIHGCNNESDKITNIITIAFSVFDQFQPIVRHEGISTYKYIGLMKEDNSNQLKSKEELKSEFSNVLEKCFSGYRNRLWKEIVSVLNTDPLFNEYNFANCDFENIINYYNFLSSGHRIVLFTITELVTLVNERTLVLIDEPENHLHPPLLSSFINALSQLLSNRNGVALMATHSPVVLQNIPSSCVTILNRSGDEYKTQRPTIETFGDNVGILTHEVFGLEVKQSGFYKTIESSINNLIKNKVQKENVYQQLSDEFSNCLGGEARIIARILIANEGEK